MGRVVSCRECESEVELPDLLKPGKVYRCPDCREPLPLPKSRPPADEEPVRRSKPRVVEDEDERPAKRPKPREEDEGEDERPPRKKKKRKSRPEPEAKPFWNSKQGRILSGLGMLLLGVVAIAAVVIFDSSTPLKGYIAGGVCILFGLGGIVSGVASSDDDSDGGDDN